LPYLTNLFLAEEIKDRQGTALIAKPMEAVAKLNLAAIAASGHTNLVVMDKSEKLKQKLMTGIWNGKAGRYESIHRRSQQILVGD